MEKRKISFAEKIRANIERQKSQKSQYGYLKLPKGVSVFKEEPGSRIKLDILPYVVTDPNHPDRDDSLGIATPGALWYKRPFKLHRNIGYNNISLVCPTSIGKRCPICEYKQRLLKEGKDWRDESVKILKASLRNLYVVVPIENKNYEEKPHIWDISDHLFQSKLSMELEENPEYSSFPDLEEGYTLRIRFTEEQFGKNKFADTGRIDFEKREKVYDKSILDKVPNLDEVLIVLPYEQIEAKFFDSEEDDTPTEVNAAVEEVIDEVIEEDEPPRKSKTIAKPATTHGKCPHGHVFGEDEGAYPECSECTEWNACADAKDELGG
ncbi:MAG TPA: hypothetical protein PKU94_08180 [Candidatus Hydrothermia bacterium]|nr:hypothetical protein [Candidatus Hydrothermia bacterium]